MSSIIARAIRDDSTTIARPTKISPIYKGPYRVISNLGSRYTLQNLVTMKEEVYLATDLQPFLFDPNVVDPRVVARDSVDEFDIDSILNHRGDTWKNKYIKKSLEFLVHWTGYDNTYDTWEPWSELRDTEQLRQYLLAKNLQYLIPKKFKDLEAQPTMRPRRGGRQAQQ